MHVRQLVLSTHHRDEAGLAMLESSVPELRRKKLIKAFRPYSLLEKLFLFFPSLSFHFPLPPLCRCSGFFHITIAAPKAA